MNNYKGASLFNDVKDSKLRAFNRAVTMLNQLEDHGTGEAGLYANCLTDFDRKEMYHIFDRMVNEGEATVRKEIMLEQA